VKALSDNSNNKIFEFAAKVPSDEGEVFIPRPADCCLRFSIVGSGLCHWVRRLEGPDHNSGSSGAVVSARPGSPLIARCHFGLGNLYRRIDYLEQAKRHLTTATSMMREMQMGLWLEKAEAELKGLG